MSSAVEKLTFTVLLLDKLSEPSKGVCQSVRKMQEMTRDAWQTIGKGSAVITGAGLALHSLTGPARGFNMAMKKVEALDAPVEELDKLGAASNRFATRFGEDAVKVIEVGKEIQSALPNLAKGALAEFAYQGALLAKASEADMVTIAKFQGTMYSIFEKDAKRIGEAKWIDQLSGKVAEALKIYKSSGDDMSAAFTNLGSSGQIAGISMDEQMAVLGSLQSTMGGAQSGTAYKAFLRSVGKAQDVLGLKFSDAKGKMLPMVEILEKIKAVTGSENLTVGNQRALTKAFGDEGARAVMNLLGKTDALRNDIKAIGDITDSSPAVKMAETMTDELAVLKSTVNVLRTTIGSTLLPTVNVLIKVMASGLQMVQWLLEKIPPLRWLFAGVTLAVAGLTIAWGGFLAVSGVVKLFRALSMELKTAWAWCLQNAAATDAMTFSQKINAVVSALWGRTIGATAIGAKLAAGAQWLWNSSLKSGAVWQKTVSIYIAIYNTLTGKQTAATALAAIATNGLSWASLKLAIQQKSLVLWTGICKAATIGWQLALVGVKIAMLAGAIPAALAMAGALGVYKLAALAAGAVSAFLGLGFWGACAATWAFTAALLACPVTWVVLGIMALVGAVILSIKYWDVICGFVKKYWDYLLLLLGPIGWVTFAFLNWDKIVGVLKSVWGWFKKICPNIANLIEKLAAIAWAGIKGVYDSWKSVFTGIYNFVGGIIRGIGDFFSNMWRGITGGASNFYDMISDKLVPVVQFFSRIFEGMGSIVSAVWNGIKSAMMGLDGWVGKVLRKIAKIPGMGFLNPDVTADEIKAVPETVAKISETTEKVVPDAVAPKESIPAMGKMPGSGVMGKMPGPGPMPVEPAALKAAPAETKDMTINVKVPEPPAIRLRESRPVLSEVTAPRQQSRDIPAGGIRNQSTNNTVNYGGVTINTSAAVGPGMLEDMHALYGGI